MEIVDFYRKFVAKISPTEFERYCYNILNSYAENENLKDFTISHNKKIESHDGIYQIDIYAEFTAINVKFRVIAECKRYTYPIEREKIVILADKVQSLGAQKGIFISTSGFQSGAITYAKEHGAQALHDRLREADPKSADAIHANNVKRVIRALEYYHETGTKISEHNEAEREKDSPYRFAYFVLNDVRSRLYERIDRRVDLMVEQGLVDEVTALKTRGCTREMVSMQGLGYKEILDYLDGKNSLEEAVTILKRDTRHFAKRQLTWFRRERDVRWIKLEDYEFDKTRILEGILNNMEKTSE